MCSLLTYWVYGKNILSFFYLLKAHYKNVLLICYTNFLSYLARLCNRDQVEISMILPKSNVMLN